MKKKINQQLEKSAKNTVMKSDNKNVIPNTGDEEETGQRRSRRIPKPKSWLDYVSFNVILKEISKSEPMSFKEALADVHSKKQNEAMKEEYKSLIKNRTWELCLPPKDKKI